MKMDNPSVEKLWNEANGLAGYFLQRKIDNVYSVVVFCLMLREITRDHSIENKIKIERMVHDALFPKSDQN